MRSMTGYGQAHWEDARVTVDAEVRTVNHRFFKLVSRLPDGLTLFESQIEELVRAHLSRGVVEVDVKLKERERHPEVSINKTLLKNYARTLRELSAGLKLKNGVDLTLLLGLPGVLAVEEDSSGRARALWPKIRGVVEEAVEEAARMRAREGKRLVATLEGLLKLIGDLLETVKKRAPLVPVEYKERLAARIETLLGGKSAGVEPPDLARELAVFADRCDISEEIQRLSSHLVEFRRAFKAEGDVGKQLDFLTQEMVREANTMGSKANDAEITRCVIAVKAEVERIKEQVQNVE